MALDAMGNGEAPTKLMRKHVKERDDKRKGERKRKEEKEREREERKRIE